MLKTKINIVYYSDTKYMPYMMTSIYSAIKNKKENSQYNIYVITQGYTKDDEVKLKKLEQQNVKIYIIPATEKALDYKHLGRFEAFKPVMQKIFIPEYLANIDKVLYLDADTIIQQDLSELYGTDIKNDYIAASRDGLMFMFPEHVSEIGLEWRNFYFNSGVMLLNLKNASALILTAFTVKSLKSISMGDTFSRKETAEPFLIKDFLSAIYNLYYSTFDFNKKEKYHIVEDTAKFIKEKFNENNYGTLVVCSTLDDFKIIEDLNLQQYINYEPFSIYKIFKYS